MFGAIEIESIEEVWCDNDTAENTLIYASSDEMFH